MTDFENWKASKRLTAYLSGADLNPDPAILSWAALEIHKAAIHVLSLPKEKREEFLKLPPPHLVPAIKAEANRVYLWRRAHR